MALLYFSAFDFVNIMLASTSFFQKKVVGINVWQNAYIYTYRLLCFVLLVVFFLFKFHFVEVYTSHSDAFLVAQLFNVAILDVCMIVVTIKPLSGQCREQINSSFQTNLHK